MVKKQKGSVLVFVMVLFSCLAILSTALGKTMVIETNNTTRQEKRKQAYNVARAGAIAASKWITSLRDVELVEFENLISNNMVYKTDPMSIDEVEGTFILEINKDQIKPQIIIKSTGKVEYGKYSNGQKKYETDTVTLILKKDKSNNMSAINTALFGISSVSINNGTVNGSIGTKGSISFDGGPSINGSVFIPLGGVVTGPDYIVKNLIVKTYDIPPDYPPPVFPSFPENLINKGSIAISGAESAAIEESGYYEQITIERNTKLTINTNDKDITLRLGSLNVIQGSIAVTGKGKVALYIDNYVTLKGSLNAGGNKGNVSVYCKNAQNGIFTVLDETQIYGSLYLYNLSITINNGGAVWGDIITAGSSVIIDGGAIVDPKVIYAPKASVEIESGGRVYGAVIGDKIILTGGPLVELKTPSIQLINPIDTEASDNGKYCDPYWK